MCYDNVKELNETILQLQDELLKLKQENENLKQHIILKDEKIIEQRFKINALEDIVDKYNRYIASIDNDICEAIYG